MAYSEKPSKTISEMAEEDNKEPLIKRKAFLLMGIPGSGKTYAAGTFDPSWKGLFLDIDDKADALQEHINSGSITRIDLRYSPDRCSMLYNKIQDIKLDLKTSIDKYQFGYVDSLSTLYPIFESASLRTLGGKTVTWDHMKWIDKEIWDFLYRIVGTIPYLVLTAHEDIRGDSDATMKVVPFARKALSNAIPGRFKEIYHATTVNDGENVCYVWETRPSGIYGSNTLIPGLPFQVPNNFGLLLSTNWRKVGDVDGAIKKYKEATGLEVTKWKPLAS